jgi:hypothetical protein
VLIKLLIRRRSVLKAKLRIAKRLSKARAIISKSVATIILTLIIKNKRKRKVVVR